MTKKNITLKTKVLVGTIILLSAGLIVFLFFSISNQINPDKFNEYLNSYNYTKAYKKYSKNELEYNEVLESHLNSIVDDYNNSIITHSETVNIINQITNSGFSGEVINNCKNNIQILKTSKSSFSSASALFNNNEIISAQEYYSNVVEWDKNYDDALSKMLDIAELLEINVNEYINGDTLYSQNDYDGAYEVYEKIVSSGINIDDAQNKISKINSINSSWLDEFPANTYEKSTYPHQASAKDEVLYLPYSYKDTHCIIKYDFETKDTEIFVIAKIPGAFVINDINIVGEYLYFVAGENVGNGKMINNPYNIYRMKNDGKELECIKQGDYVNLIAYTEGFYASSYSQGLVKLDRQLNIVEQLSGDTPIQIQLVKDTLYYTVDTHNPYKIEYMQYSYDGNENTEIISLPHLFFYFYNDIELYTYRYGEYHCEALFFLNKEDNKIYKKGLENFRGIYNVSENKIICSQEDRKGQMEYYIFNLENRTKEKYTDKLPDDIIALEKVCYTNNTLIFSTNNGYLITDNAYNVMERVDMSQIDLEHSNPNNEIDFLHNGDYYTEDEVVVIEEGFWYYSNHEYNIRIEERYIDSLDSNVFVAHIRTTSPNYISIDSPYEDTYLTRQRKHPVDLARQYSAVFACNSDFFEENDWTGIAMRDGVIYKDTLKQDMAVIYPDGRLICYSKEDNITSEDLLNAGVINTLSFGPILLSDGKYGNDIYTNFLAVPNPRNAIGMIEPGHYVVILADGRQSLSSGLTFRGLASLFVKEGCVEAYNLDGGQTAAMMFMGEYVNTHFHDNDGIYFRQLSDIIYFASSDLVSN